jgi:hypothetical protein
MVETSIVLRIPYQEKGGLSTQKNEKKQKDLDTN